MKRLETERLISRKFTEDDVAGMFKNWASDVETTKYVSFVLIKILKKEKK